MLQGGTDGGEIGLGQRAFLHGAIDRDVDGFGIGEENRLGFAVPGAEEAVGKLDDRGAQAGDVGFDGDEVVVASRRFVAAGSFDDGKMAVVLELHLFVLETELAEELDAANFAPDEVVGVVGDTHLVGFSVADAESGGGRRHEAMVLALTFVRGGPPSPHPPLRDGR